MTTSLLSPLLDELSDFVTDTQIRLHTIAAALGESPQPESSTETSATAAPGETIPHHQPISCAGPRSDNQTSNELPNGDTQTCTSQPAHQDPTVAGDEPNRPRIHNNPATRDPTTCDPTSGSADDRLTAIKRRLARQLAAQSTKHDESN